MRSSVRLLRFLVPAVALLGSSACTVKPATEVPPATTGDADSGGAEDPADPGRQPVPAPEPAGDDGGGSVDPEAGCSTDADCGDDMRCEGMGCGEGEGVCVPNDRACTRDLRPYCGCDGETFKSSGSCPGKRFAYRGECAAPLPDGSDCVAAEQCESGVCEGQGCSDDAPGKCMPKERTCTADLAPYCDCHGRDFQTSGTCPGKRFAAKGTCADAGAGAQ